MTTRINMLLQRAKWRPQIQWRMPRRFSRFATRGVNIISHHLYAPNGVGQASRNVITALATTNIPFSIYPMESHRDSRNSDLNLEHIPRGAPYGINLFF